MGIRSSPNAYPAMIALIASGAARAQSLVRMFGAETVSVFP